MKSSLWVIIVILVAILSFLIGYSVAPRDASLAGAGAPGVEAPGYGGGYGGG